MAAKPTLARLRVYPVKSLGGIDVDEWELDDFGLRYDRRWMVVDPSGHFLSQRDHPGLAAVSVEISDDRLVLSAAGRNPVDVALEPESGPTEPVVIWDDTVAAIHVSDDVDRWLSELLRTSCSLVFIPDSSVRAVDPEHAVGRAQLAFVDGFPLLLVGTESLDELNRRLAKPVPIERFRPNLVIHGTPAPHAEDAWRRIRIGRLEIHVVKPCSRCVVTTTDQNTGERSKEPLRTLATYRTRDGKVYFGQNAIHTARGSLKVGDEVEVLETGDSVFHGEADHAAEEPEAEPAPKRGARAILRALVGRGESKKSDSPAGAKSSDGDFDLTLPESGAALDNLLPGEEHLLPIEGDTLNLSLDDDEDEEFDEDEVTEEELEEEEPEEEESEEEPEEEEPEEEEPEEEEPEEVVERKVEARPASRPAAPAAGARSGAGKKVRGAKPRGPAAGRPPPARGTVEIRTGRIPTTEEVIRLLDAAVVADSRGDLERLADACVEAEILLTAWRGDELVGLLRGWTDGVRDGFLSDVAVHPDHHDLEIAESLVRRAVAFHPDVRWVLRAFSGSVYLGSALDWQHVGSGWYISPR